MKTTDQQSCEQLNELALQHYARQQVEEAVALWRRALELSPDHMDILIYLGAALRSLGQSDAAAAHYERALRLQPKMQEIYYNLGNAYLYTLSFYSPLLCHPLYMDEIECQ